MRIIAVLVLLLGFGLAGGAVFYMFQQFKAAEARVAQLQPEVIKVPTVQIAVAKEDLRFGQPITKDDVRFIEWPAEAAPVNGFREVTELFSEDGVVRTVLRRMEPNEPILRSKVTGFGEFATVAALLDPGMRAHTMRVNATNSVGGFLLPGTRIDVVLTAKRQSGSLETYFLLQNIEVIATDQDTDRDRTRARVARTVTVQVTPKQVRQLTLAESLGKISIVLRGFGSQDVASDEVLDRDELLGIVREEVVEETVEEAPQVKVRRGIGYATESVDDALAEDNPEPDDGF